MVVPPVAVVVKKSGWNPQKGCEPSKKKKRKKKRIVIRKKKRLESAEGVRALKKKVMPKANAFAWAGHR